MSCHNEDLSEEQLLIERVKAGDTRAVDILVKHYKTPLFAFILRMTSHYETAEDIFQETWIRVIRSIQRFRGDARRPAREGAPDGLGERPSIKDQHAGELEEVVIVLGSAVGLS